MFAIAACSLADMHDAAPPHLQLVSLPTLVEGFERACVLSLVLRFLALLLGMQCHEGLAFDLPLLETSLSSRRSPLRGSSGSTTQGLIAKLTIRLRLRATKDRIRFFHLACWSSFITTSVLQQLMNTSICLGRV